MPAGQPGSKPAPGCASHDTERPGQLLHHQLNGQRGTRDERVANHLPDLPPLPPLTSPPLPRRVRGAGGGTALTLRGGEQSCHPTVLPSWSAARQERGPFTPRTAPRHTTSLVQPHPWHSCIPGAAASLVQPHPHHTSSTPTTQLLSAFFSIQPRVRTCFKKSPFPTSTGEKSDLKRHKPQKAPSALPKYRFCACRVIFTLIS